MDGWGFFIFLWFGMGIMGSVLGAIVSKVIAGFFLGFFLGPFGWIIVFLLPRDEESKEVSAPQKTKQKTEPRNRTDRPERNLESNAYRIWLGKTYNIQKNELFEKYEYDNDLFDTLEEALLEADQKDRDSEEE